MENCLICNMETANTFRGFDICLCCEDKFGSWDKIKEKLLSMNIPDWLYNKLTAIDEKTKTIKPFECSLSYSGGTKQDIINLITGLMDNEEISLNELERGML